MRASFILQQVLFVLALIFTLARSARLFTEEEYKTAFLEWTRKYDKVYTQHEFQSRYQIFKDSMDFVYEWNQENDLTQVSLNFMSDLSDAEYRAYYLSTPIEIPQNVSTNKISIDTTGLPDSVDWRTAGVVTPIKQQGHCGSCWAFSTTGAIEGIQALSTGNLVSLSEQNLVDCVIHSNGCGGGSFINAFIYVINNGGIDTEASYPYTAAQGTCAYNPANVGATIAGYTCLTPDSGEGTLMQAVAQQPVSVAIDAGLPAFKHYSGGVYYNPNCGPTALDHAVLVIGYGNYNGTDYWLVKNSWGTDWGMGGYAYMARGDDNNCGIDSRPCYPTVSTSVTATGTSYMNIDGTYRSNVAGGQGDAAPPVTETQAGQFTF